MTEETKETGYVYCMSNPSMPGILKVGGTWSLERTPDMRAKELYTTGVPTPFKIEFAKLVSEPKNKETTLHLLLEQYTERVNGRREFFRVSPEIIKTFFDLMDGDMWVDTRKVEDEEEEEEDEGGEGEGKVTKVTKDRDMRKYFTDGQRISHTIGVDKTWIGTYDYANNRIICDTIFYKSPSGFVNTHHKENGTYTSRGVNGWVYAKYELDGQWNSMSKIQPLQ
jgi:hypothetical protein